MNRLTTALLGLILLVPSHSCTAGELQEMEQKIFSANKPISSREWLVKLGLLEKWSKEGEESILEDTDGSLGQFDRTYRTKGYKDITQVTLSSRKDNMAGDGTKDLVTLIVFADKTYYYVYYWTGERYVQSGTHRIVNP